MRSEIDFDLPLIGAALRGACERSLLAHLLARQVPAHRLRMNDAQRRVAEGAELRRRSARQLGLERRNSFCQIVEFAAHQGVFASRLQPAERACNG